ncbi:glycosyltransferase family 2 protein [Pedobacter heparinus]|uniref:glycosyltransferase family 2 protein n=1 Tax=Pedobacter heparinus TaxID=984 RepID=UPI00292D375F|nr:glycosyltransferase family 2 protein [Pedobacter heparinus]
MKISILTPSFNSGKYLERAIQSVLNQDYTNYEHIVVDGGSNDETITILNKHKHLIYVSEKDKGQSDAMNKAFHMSSGDLIVYLNADDEFAPGSFKKVVAAFQESDKIDMIVGNLLFLSPDEQLIRYPSARYRDILLYWKNLFPNNPVSYYYKRKVQIRIGDFPVDNHYSMDIWFLLKAYKLFKIAKVEAMLGTFHSDGTNKTATVDTGFALHNAVKTHLKKENPLLLPYFYFKLLVGRFM